jgi:lysozyme
MRTSRAGLAAIILREGVRRKAYQDSVGVWTIGVGHTGPPAGPGRRITMGRVRRLLRQDVREVERALDRFHLPAQRMFDALVSFGFNLGVGIFGTEHTIGAALHRHDWDAVSRSLMLYDVAGGRKLLGLFNRRKSERRQFNRGLRAWRRRHRH